MLLRSQDYYKTMATGFGNMDVIQDLEKGNLCEGVKSKPGGSD